MRRSQLSLVTAILSLAGAVLWFALEEPVSGLIWIAISLVWAAIAIGQTRKPAIEPAPGARLLRRFSRLIMFWS